MWVVIRSLKQLPNGRPISDMPLLLRKVLAI